MEVTRVFLTVDTELAWRHHAGGLDIDETFARSIEPAGVGISWQVRTLSAHGLRACFFVDPMPAAVYGTGLIERVVAPIVEGGMDVQLHIHPNWAGASLADRAVHAPFELTSYPPAEQRDLLAQASTYLQAAGAPQPVAFRAGSYSADDATLAALVDLGIAFDCSFNAAYPTISKVSLDPRNLAPRRHAGLVACPVGVIAERDGQYRTMQICALSVEEVEAALLHAETHRHALTTIVGHSFELATRCGTAENRVHRERFEWLCGFLAKHRDRFVTIGASELADVPLDRTDVPLPHDSARWLRRQTEQAWVNSMIEQPARRSRVELGAAKVLPHVDVTTMAWNRWGYTLLESVEAASRGLL